MRPQGIYVITAPSGEFYIGSSTDVPRRFCGHRSDLRRGVHHSRALQAASDKYGLAAMRFEFIFSVLDRGWLRAYEQRFICARGPALNATSLVGPGAADPRVAAAISRSARASARHSVARVANQRLASVAVSKAVVRLTDGVVFPSGYAAARAHGATHPDNISTAIRRGWQFAGHYWKFVGDSTTLEEVVARAAARAEAVRVRDAKRMERQRGRPVCASDGRTFPSIRSAARAVGCHSTALHRALRDGTPSMRLRWAYV